MAGNLNDDPSFNARHSANLAYLAQIGARHAFSREMFVAYSLPLEPRFQRVAGENIGRLFFKLHSDGNVTAETSVGYADNYSSIMIPSDSRIESQIRIVQDQLDTLNALVAQSLGIERVGMTYRHGLPVFYGLSGVDAEVVLPGRSVEEVHKQMLLRLDDLVTPRLDEIVLDTTKIRERQGEISTYVTEHIGTMSIVGSMDPRSYRQAIDFVRNSVMAGVWTSTVGALTQEMNGEGNPIISRTRERHEYEALIHHIQHEVDCAVSSYGDVRFLVRDIKRTQLLVPALTRAPVVKEVLKSVEGRRFADPFNSFRIRFVEYTPDTPREL